MTDKKLSSLRSRINDQSKKARSYIDGNLFGQYHDLMAQIDQGLRQSEVLFQELKRRRTATRIELQALTDSQTHRSLGAKKKISELLADFHDAGRLRLASMSAQNTALHFDKVSYHLENRCLNLTCQAWISPAMAYCPLCGKSTNYGSEIRFYKKDISDNFTCESCYAPSMVEFKYCFNCGQTQDPFGLLRFHR